MDIPTAASWATSTAEDLAKWGMLREAGVIRDATDGELAALGLALRGHLVEGVDDVLHSVGE